MISKIFFLTVALFSLLCLAQQQSRKLIFVEQIFRHGARYPLGFNNIDGSNITEKDNALGELTNQGKSQHYLLGKKMYETYWKPLFGNNNKYRQQKFYFKSTDINRTIQSLNSHLLGLFENTERLQIKEEEIPFSLPVWNDNFMRKAGFLYEKSPNYHPLPIHVQKGAFSPWSQGDFLLTYWPEYCVKQKEWIEANKRDLYIVEITKNKNFVAAAQALGQVFQKDISFYQVSQYKDNAEALKFMGVKPLPIFIGDTQVTKDMNTMMVLQGYMRLFHTEEQLRPISTPFFNQTITHIKRVTKDQEGVQWVFYSAHDYTIQTILVRMGLASVECIYQNYLNGTLKDTQNEYCIVQNPAYSSQIIFEVYQYTNKTNTFQIRYNGNYRRIPFCSWKFECDVEVLYKWYQSWKDENWVRTCGIKDSTVETYFSIMMVQLGVIIIFVVGVVLRNLNKKKVDKILVQEESKGIVSSSGQNNFQQSLISDQAQNH